MKKASIIIVCVLVAIQFIRIDKTNLPVDTSQDYVSLTHAPDQVASILKRACYDCHSNQVKYPWYTQVAPVSWYIKSHVNNGKEFLNFSEFGKYNTYQKEHIYKGLVSSTERGTMPLDSYLWVHKEAILTPQDRNILLEWFNTFIPEDSKQ